MSISINTNTMSLLVQRKLAQATDAISRSFERLASGMRINRPSDDAASLAVATKLDFDSRIFARGIRNINDSVSALNVAEGSLQELSSIVQRQKELAEQAANGAYSAVQRRALDREAKALTDEFNRTVATTTFNGISLLADGGASIATQAGYGAGAVLDLRTGAALARSEGTFTFSSTTLDLAGGDEPNGIVLADVDNDGKLDLLEINYTSEDIQMFRGNGDGSFSAPTVVSPAAMGWLLKSGDFNGDGKVDLISASFSNGVQILLGTGTGSFNASSAFNLGSGGHLESLVIADFNGDGTMDIAGTNSGVSNFAVALGNGNGTFLAVRTYAGPGAFTSLTAVDINGDGRQDVVATGSTNTASVFLGSASGVFSLANNFSVTSNARGVTSGDINYDGFQDVVIRSTTGITAYLGNNDGTVRTGQFYAQASSDRKVFLVDINTDGVLDIFSGGIMLAGNRDGTFSVPAGSFLNSAISETTIAFGDISGDGVLDAVSSTSGAFYSVNVFVQYGRTTSNTEHISLASQADARAALDDLEIVSTRISQAIADIGAMQSRSETALRALSHRQIGTEAALSRIRDVDVAEESSHLVRMQILQQAGAAVLAQANSAPQIALVLLN